VVRGQPTNNIEHYTTTSYGLFKSIGWKSLKYRAWVALRFLWVATHSPLLFLTFQPNGSSKPRLKIVRIINSWLMKLYFLS
jgi:hypothetical protein